MRAKAFLVLTFVLFAISSGLAGTQKVLYAFTGGADGGQPYAGVIFDPAGNLYGVTQAGGAYNKGTVFELSPSKDGWTETVLYSFTGGTDGSEPVGGLTIDTSGNLYGTTESGGDQLVQCGTVFELAPAAGNWTFTALHTFDGTDGCAPVANVSLAYTETYIQSTTASGGKSNQGITFQVPVVGQPGNFSYESLTGNVGSGPFGNMNAWSYGTTSFGGSYGRGTIYEYLWGRHFATTHVFNVGKEGYDPYGDLLTQVIDGVDVMDGTTNIGGVGGRGTAYRLTQTEKGGWALSVLHSFSGLDGDGPGAGLIVDSAGNLYGTTMFGGANSGYAGTVFELTPGAKNKWTEILQYSFSGGTDGGVITSGVVFDTAGNLYGTASTGGAHNQGVVYEVTPSAATTTTLTSSPNPSTHDQAVIFTAVVASKIGAPPDGETVSFMKGKTVLGTGSLSGGSASFTTAKLPVGTDSITAIYGGDSNFDASTSNVVAQVVEKAGT
ncbi:MAG: Ig-like domain-containing protein [Terriglobales bacterium]|jgi:uncharacterized repeat protein (TIGR03803 family)